jgi:protein-disulfide isomerase
VRPYLALIAVVFLLAVGTASAAPEHALTERALGAADAPVTIHEYASLTCPHCATVHRDVLPEIKSTYIDTGKARLVFHDFPLDRLALIAAMTARCAPPERYFGYLEVLFRQQEQWSRAADPRAALLRIAKMGGLSEAEFNACVSDQGLLNAIRQRAEDDSRRHSIKSTPTFLIGDKRIEGSAPLAQFKAAIDAALAAAGKS